MFVAMTVVTLVGTTLVSANVDTNVNLARDVQRAILRYVYFTVFDDVEVDIEPDGGVVLRGHVTASHKRTGIVNRVAAVDGVNRVQSALEVLPVSRLDNELRYRVARSIYGSSTFWRYAARRNPPIHIVVERGHVTLTGVVNNEADKAIAGILASSSGAFSLRNDLTLAQEVEQSK